MIRAKAAFAPGSIEKRPAFSKRRHRVAEPAALLIAVAIVMGLFSASAFAQSYTWNNADANGGGGFIPGIVFNLSQPNLIYARTDIGGAYRWDATNQRWIPLMDWVAFDDWNTLGVESIATDARHG